MGKKQPTVVRRGNDLAVASTDKTSPGPEDYDPSVDEPEETLSVESTVVSRETATHLAFAKSRKDDFVYAETEHYMRILSEFCDWDRDAGPNQQHQSSVFVVVGRAGTGKSALLANWADQRRRHCQSRSSGADGSSVASSSSALASGETVNELVYEHYAGCSYDSVKLSLFLFRFMHQIKVSHGLRDFELPHEHEEEKLKFSLVRCLEAAVGKRGGGRAVGATSQHKRIILVLDGIDCIRTEDGSDSLSWLPNNFPPNVRIIVSATLPSSDKKGRPQGCRSVKRKPAEVDEDGDLLFDFSLRASDHDSRTVRELRRRNARFLEVEPLDESTCRVIIELYNSKCTNSLLPEEKELLLAGRGSANPLYMRLLLTTLEHSFLETSGSPHQRLRWLQHASEIGDLQSAFEMVLKRWNEVLLAELYVQLQQFKTMLEATAAANALNATNPKPLRRVPSKIANSSSDIAGTDTASGDQLSLSKSGSMRSLVKSGSRSLSNGYTVMPSTSESAELEAIEASIEQRALLIRHVLSLLAVTRYGLSEADLVNLIGNLIDRSVVDKLMTLLRPHLMEIRRFDCGPSGSGPAGVDSSTRRSSSNSSHKNDVSDVVVLYDLSHNQLRRITRYGFLHDPHLRGTYYRGLATYFGNMEACQRRIDELPVQLERCAMWSVLQSALVNIKMFQLWWSKRNRQEFFSHWLELASNSQTHDPVDDFIRSLDEFIIHDNPSADQMLNLFMTITAFLRAWQQVSSGAIAASTSSNSDVTLNRPKPPQLQEFITSLVSFSTAHLPEREARRVQQEIVSLCTHSDDGYIVQRWLWTQFPLIGIAFECRVVRSTSSKTTINNGGTSSDANTKNNLESAANPPSTSIDTSADSSGLASLPSKSSKSTVAFPSTEVGPGSTSKRFVTGKRMPSSQRALALSIESPSMLDSDDVCGAFEFLSPDKGDAGLSSVSKIESQLVELRTKHDKLKFAVREKTELLQTLESRVVEARAQAQAVGQSASQTDELQEQIRKVGDETAIGRQRGDYYRAILRHCEVNPARDPNIIESAEAVVHKLRQEIVELQQRAQVLSYETRLASAELPKLRQATQDKATIHQAALDRLRWRRELNLRMASRSGLAPARVKKIIARSPSEAKEKESAQGAKPNEVLSAAVPTSPSDVEPPVVVDANFMRAKERLLHMKETSVVRQRNAATLQMYLGSAYKDDGVLGALRHVGINHPEEVQAYWQSQIDHAGQLEEEGKQAELRVAELRDRLQTLQTQFVNLKLGGSVSARQDEDTVVNAVGSPLSGGGANGAPPRATTKELEQQIADAAATNQHRRERVAWMRALHEKLQLGLLHIAQILGAASSSTAAAELDLLGLSEAIELGVRHVLGDETHLQSTSTASMRRKNSVRAGNPHPLVGVGTGSSSVSSGLGNSAAVASIAAAGGTVAGSPLLGHASRTDDDRLRYNIRVPLSPQWRQMNPYTVENPDDQRREDKGEEDDDEDEEEDDEVDNNRKPSTVSGLRRTSRRASTASGPVEEAVKRRSDIKNSSRLEIEKKKAAQKAKARKKAAASE